MEPKEWMQCKKSVLNNHKMELLRQQVLMEEKQYFNTLKENEEYDYLVSQLNYFRRRNGNTSLDFNVIVKCGDICYIDFGHSYLFEVAYLHFGLVLSMRRGKAFVVPLTGADSKVMDSSQMDHIYLLGKVKGMSKISACYLNDAKWINSARIIDVKAHISVRSKMFLEIKEKIKEGID